METEVADSGQGNPWVALWRGVIYQALLDLHQVSSTYSNAHFKLRNDAQRFFFESAYFERVCDMAGLDPDAVRGVAQKCIDNPSYLSNTRLTTAYRNPRAGFYHRKRRSRPRVRRLRRERATPHAPTH